MHQITVAGVAHLPDAGARISIGRQRRLTRASLSTLRSGSISPDIAAPQSWHRWVGAIDQRRYNPAPGAPEPAPGRRPHRRPSGRRFHRSFAARREGRCPLLLAGAAGLTSACSSRGSAVPELPGRSGLRRGESDFLALFPIPSPRNHSPGRRTRTAVEDLTHAGASPHHLGTRLRQRVWWEGVPVPAPSGALSLPAMAMPEGASVLRWTRQPVAMAPNPSPR